MIRKSLVTVALSVLVACGAREPSRSFSYEGSEAFEVGVSKKDMTGPALGLGTNGYAAPTPKTSGIRQRLFARAAIIKERTSDKRVALVLLDTAFISWGMKALVLEELAKTHGSLFRTENLVLTATHTHSSPGGYSNNYYYNIPYEGLSRQNLNIIVHAVADAVHDANESLVPANIRLNAAELSGANINRSPFAYLNNPESERVRYTANTDTESSQLTFLDHSGRPIGLWNWFAVHGTSVKKDNSLINGDNKGYAADRVENSHRASGLAGFVAAFPSKSSGDSSPNTSGDRGDGGEWSCPVGENFGCAAYIGDKMADKAEALTTAAGELLDGKIDYRHAFVEMGDHKVAAPWSNGAASAKTCQTAVGTSMIAGSAADGPGLGKEGRTCSTATTRVERLKCTINPCHGEKVVALQTGIQNPMWINSVMPIQLIRIGSLVISAGPGEYTTMSGRRIEASLKPMFAGLGVRKVIHMGYSNDYAGYTTTREEYQLQYYEGGHTVFGEWQLAAYQEQFAKLSEAMVSNQVPPTLNPPTLLYGSFQEAVAASGDDAAGARPFGTILTEVLPHYAAGETASLTIIGANPNNDMMTESSFFDVQRRHGAIWQTVRTDNSWDTSIEWSKSSNILHAKLQWMIPVATDVGTYRIQYRGVSRTGGVLKPFSGVSREFEIE